MRIANGILNAVSHLNNGVLIIIATAVKISTKSDAIRWSVNSTAIFLGRKQKRWFDLRVGKTFYRSFCLPIDGKFRDDKNELNIACLFAAKSPLANFKQQSVDRFSKSISCIGDNKRTTQFMKIFFRLKFFLPSSDFRLWQVATNNLWRWSWLNH